MKKLENICLVLFVLLCGQICAFAAQLTDSERRGKEIYLRGTSSSGREIVGRVGDVEVPGSTVSCSGCHGARGEGKTEAGVTAGSLIWSNLIKPYGHQHTSGRKHKPFNESSFIHAVVNGIDSSGNNLLVAMPRYKLSPQDVSDLMAYLKRIDSDLDPGLTDGTVRIGMVLPAQGALADVGAAMKDVFAAYFDDVNSRGGIFSRKIDLRFTDAGGTDIAAAVQSFARQEEIFAFVGGVSAGADSQLATLAKREALPFIGPSTLMPHFESPVNRYLFYMLPGVADQAVSLVNFAAAQRELQNVRRAVVYNDSTLGSAAALAVVERSKKLGRGVETKVSYTTASFDAKRMVTDLKSKDIQAVFFFGAGKEESALIAEAAAAGWTPNLFLLAAMTGKELHGAASAAFKNKIFIAFPTVPSDITTEGRAEFRALHEKYRFAPRHTASQLAAFATAKMFVEALTRAGKDLTREKLITSVEGFYDYETGVTPRITFGPNRRLGAAGAHVVAIDVAESQFATASGWVKN